MYEKLVKKYNNLSLEAQGALLIYKSHLSYAINNINRIDSPDVLKEIRDLYLIYKEKIESSYNMFIKTMFNQVDFSTFEKFLKDIKKIEILLNSLEGKMVMDEDTMLYRGVSFKEGDDIYSISVDNLISTTLSYGKASEFHIYGPYTNILYCISVEKGTPCLVIPYTIKELDNGILKLENNDSQKEVILFRDSIDMIVNKDGKDYIKVMTKIKK